jgi:uncharacterized protein YbaR (Trm112 family)
MFAKSDDGSSSPGAARAENNQSCRGGMNVAVDLAPELLEILACPNCHGALAVDHDRDELVCLAADCGLAYPVRQQIPVLLIDEARRPDSRTDRPGIPSGR